MQRLAAMMLVFIASISSAMADTKLYIEDFSISAGETKQVAVCLDTDVADLNTVSMTIKVPTGLTLATKEFMGKDVIDATINTSRAVGFTPVGNADNGKISLSSTNKIAAGTGALFYIKVTADESLAVTSTLALEDAKAMGSATYSVANGNLTVGNATVTKLGDISVAFAQSPITMEPGGTYSMAVNMTNTGKKVVGFQADLKLPTGWTATISNGRLTNSGTGYRIQYSDINNPISGEEGALFTINLVAPSTFTTGSAEVKLEDIYATVGTTEEQLANITLTVNSNGGVVSGKPVVTFTKPEIVIHAGKTGNVDVNMLNTGLDIKGFQADLVLPEGWTAQVVNGRLTNSGSGNRIMYADFMNSIPDEDGVLFSLALTTPETFTGEAAVKLTNISATVGFKEEKLEDITVTVKAVDESVETAKQALKDEIAAATALLGEADKTVEPGKSLNDAIVAAQAVLDAEYPTIDEVNQATETLKAAEQAYQAALEEAAVKAANEKLAELKTAAEALKVSDEAKAYGAETVKAAVAAAEEAIKAAKDAVAAVEAKIAEGKVATDNKEALAAAIAAAEKAIADAKTAIENAEKTYADQKAADEEAAAKAAADTKLAELKAAADALTVSDEAKAYDNETVKAAVAAAEDAIKAAKDAVAAVEAKIAEGKLATDNKEALAAAIAAAEKAIADAQAAIAAAEKAYADAKNAYENSLAGLIETALKSVEPGEDATVALNKDYDVTTPIVVPADKSLTIIGNKKTLTVSEDGAFVLNNGFTLKNVTIDASALTKPLVQMNGTPEIEAVESGQYVIKNAITFDNVKATGLTKNLFSDNSKAYVYDQFTINNCIFEYATQTGVVLNLASSMAVNFNITNSTMYSKEAGTANFIAMSGKRPWQVTGYENETGKMTVANNTFYNVAKSKQFMNTNTLKGQKYLYEFNSNIFVNVSNKKIYGNMTNNKKQLTTDGKNTYLFDGEFFAETNYNGDEGLQTDPSFADAAAGDFTIGATTFQAREKTGDSRWLVPFVAPADVDKTALESEIATATNLLADAATDVEPGKSLKEAIDAAKAVDEDANVFQTEVDAAVEALKAAEEAYKTATGIAGVKVNDLMKDDGAVYNMNGVRVMNPTKGLYIKNGKKYVVK